jgi:DNA-binding response OmpR family regulator
VQRRILIIDDDEELCEELAEILTDGGYRVQVANDGLSGTTCLEEQEYDLLLLDLKIPGRCGFDILKHVKAQGSKVKVLVITGRPQASELQDSSSRSEEEQLLKLADRLLNKPFDVQKLLNDVRVLLESR